MSRKYLDTGKLWQSLFLLIFALLIIVIGIFVYLPLDESIRDYLSKENSRKTETKTIAKKSVISDEDWDRVEDGIHVMTGMIYDENFDLVRASCTYCHSAKLITQNRADRSGWKQMINWMQATQNLPDLGQNESRILDYLAKHYAPIETGRRPNLDIEAIEWYVYDITDN